MIHDWYLFSVSSACLKSYWLKKFLLRTWLYLCFVHILHQLNLCKLMQHFVLHQEKPLVLFCPSFSCKSPCSSDQTATAATFELISPAAAFCLLASPRCSSSVVCLCNLDQARLSPRRLPPRWRLIESPSVNNARVSDVKSERCGCCARLM